MRSDALAAGSSDRELGRLVRAGVLRRIRPGAYVAADAWATLDDAQQHRVRARAVLRKAQTEVVLSHVSAVPEYGAPTWGLSLDDVHLTRTDRCAGRKEAGIRQHQGRLFSPDVVSRDGVDVTSATKLALDITTVASLEASLCVVNYLLHAQMTSPEDLVERYRWMENDPHTLRTDLVLRLADSRIESVGETRTFVLCWRESLPMPQLQYAVAGTRLDFAWPKHGKWLEFDGKQKYVQFARPGESVADVVLREKQREDMIRELTGWQCLRITWSDLERPSRLAARIRTFLGVPAVATIAARRWA